MSADATAAGLYNSAVSRFNPMESFMAGVQTAHAAKRLALAESGMLFDVMMKQQSQQVDREQLALKAKALDEQTKLDWFNAQTNRLNATRPLRGSASGTSSGITPTFGTDEDGNMTVSFNQTPAEDVQAPTDGEGDGPEVVALRPGTTSPTLLPGGAEMTQTAPGMPAPSMAGEPPRPSPVPTAAPKKPQKYVTGGSSNLKTGSQTINWSTTPPNKDDDAPITPQMFDGFKRLAESEGMEIGDMTATGKGLKDIKITKREGSGDISISSLPADEQKRWAGNMTKLVTMAQSVRDASNLKGLSDTQIDAKKMAAVGKTDPDEMTPEDWARGYQLITPEGSLQELTKAATEYAANMNLTFQGKKGFVPRTAESVLIDLGVNPTPPKPAPQTVATAPGATAALATTKAAAATPAPNATPELQNQITALKQEIATEKDPKVKGLKEAFLQTLEKTAASQPAAPAASTDPFQAIAASQSTAQSAEAAMASKKEADRLRWEQNKTTVLNAMVTTGGRDLIEDLATHGGEHDWTTGEKSRESKWLDWFNQNKGKLGIQTQDGKPADSLRDVVFKDSSGRKITVGDIIAAALEDPRTKEALKAPARKEAVAAQGGAFTPQTQTVLQQAGLSK